ncbi:MAG TPA: outer membrane beta-barrel protein [Burkholderiaceae bacterium]|nr:outer membrane beta-barrel protein [Burkholderiaceae bacterium]
MKKLMALAMAAAFTAPAFAADFYAGADIGRGKIDGHTEVIGGTTVTMADWKDTTYAIFGGYQLNETISFELGYRSMGKNTVDVGGKTVEVKGSALQASMLASLPLGNDFSAFGRLGFNSFKAKANYNGNTGSSSDSKALVGFGVRYAMSKEAGVRAEFQKLASDASALTVGVDFKF